VDGNSKEGTMADAAWTVEYTGELGDIWTAPRTMTREAARALVRLTMADGFEPSRRACVREARAVAVTTLAEAELIAAGARS
jgi:hypothetical protein